MAKSDREAGRASERRDERPRGRATSERATACVFECFQWRSNRSTVLFSDRFVWFQETRPRREPSDRDEERAIDRRDARPRFGLNHLRFQLVSMLFGRGDRAEERATE